MWIAAFVLTDEMNPCLIAPIPQNGKFPSQQFSSVICNQYSRRKTGVAKIESGDSEVRERATDFNSNLYEQHIWNF